MKCTAFEGPAGSGKTHRLLESLGQHLAENELGEGQRVLATTYMHGSRRRLEASLRAILGLGGRYECSTLDSVALRWTRRWRTLADELGLTIPDHGDFDNVCAHAAKLLKVGTVRSWVTSSFPVMLVDEAQDLTSERLAIVRALAGGARTFIAGDEFQCLQDKLRPNPFSDWCAKELEPTRLTQIHRTGAAGLLDAAAALRGGKAPKGKGAFEIKATPSSALAGAYLVNAVSWYSQGGTVAILAPSFPPFVVAAIAWAEQNKTNQGHGPLNVRRERSEKDERTELLKRLDMAAEASVADVHAAVEALGAPMIAPYVYAWAERQRNALGRARLTKEEVETAIGQALANRRRFGKVGEGRTSVMSIHTAKNREFDGVIVLWPYQVAGTDDQKRRLLYNAVTRAKKWTRVLVQHEKILSTAPFSA